jgi:hydroxymethylbilane synthase
VKPVRIGTRGSKLALWQANTVARLLTERGAHCEIVVIRTSGDEQSSAPPDAPVTNVKATFVKEIEDALTSGRVDIAVHSSKDLSASLPPGLVIAAALAREDPRDALLLPGATRLGSVDELRVSGNGVRIGTSSVRRAAQLRTLVPGATFLPIRGNVDTRLAKLDGGACDAMVLACAGLNRLGLQHRVSLALPVEACVPAPGQGIVAIQARMNEPELCDTLRTINDANAIDALIAERAVVSALGGSCQMPLGAHARIDNDDLSMVGVVISRDAHGVARAEVAGPRAQADALGQRLAQSLVDRGALKFLSS